MRIMIVTRQQEKLIRQSLNSQIERSVEAAGEDDGYRDEMLEEVSELAAVVRRFWPKDNHAHGGHLDANGFWIPGKGN